MASVYQVEFKQYDRRGVPYNSTKLDVAAKSAEQAISKGRRLAIKEDVWLKRRKLELTGLSIVVLNLN